MVSQEEIAKELNVEIPVSGDMQLALSEWADAYTNRSYWLREDIISLELASEIASETSRLVTGGGKSWVSGSERGIYIQSQYENFMANIRPKVEFACALGGIAFKPYLAGKNIKVEPITADRFFPVKFGSDGEVDAAIFCEKRTVGKQFFTRLEHHDLDENSGVYTVTNRAFVSNDKQSLGRECYLSDVPLWSDYTEKMVIQDVEKPLFAYFKMPAANNVDMSSPLGMSCYQKAIEQIRQADQHWERIMWEYQGSELAVMAERSMFFVDKGKPVIPRGKKRLFRLLNGDSGNLLKEFSPAIRDSSLFNGLNRILQRIEYNCDLAYGTISDPQTVEKTAAEVRAGRDRSRSSMQEKQKSLEHALKHLIWIFNEYADYYKLAPQGKYETVFEWGDGVAIDRDEEFQRRLQLATAGKYSWEHFLAWYFGCSVEKAAELIPSTLPLFGGGA